MPTVTPPNMLTREEAAEFLGVKPGTLEVWASTQRYSLPYVKVGRCVRYRRADLDQFIEAQTVRPHASR